MCGIVGVVGPPGSEIDVRGVRDALTLLRHRGPDDEGYVLADTNRHLAFVGGGRATDSRLSLPDVLDACREGVNIALGHRRLSILDLSPAGHQPMASQDGSCWMILNGEIYNYVELREELCKLGHAFYTASDTEVVLAAYRQWGHEMLTKFVGMFAVVIVNVADGTFFAARDAFGIKPLYYSLRGNQLVFGSEIKALLGVAGVGRGVNPGRLYDYLLFGVTDFADETFFADVRQLPAAHFMECKLEDLASALPLRFWRIDLGRRASCSFDEAAVGVRDRFIESVRLHMRSDVPVGSCLSGGLDSSAVVACMRRAAGPNAAIHTFTYAADDVSLDEEAFADLVSRREETTPHKTRPTAGEMAADLDRLVYLQDEPFRSTSIYAQFRVFQLAGEAGMKVMLDGQGADEIFGGYLNFLAARVAGLLAQGRLVAAVRAARGAPRNESANFSRMVASSLVRLLPEATGRTVRRAADESLRPPWLNGRWFGERGVTAHQRPQGRGEEALREELLLSVETLSLPQLLRYEDRNSMAHSIESRVPFCNAALAEFVLSLPADHLVARDGTSKAVLRGAAETFVPRQVLAREKIGFAVPERAWLSSLGPWISGCLKEISPAEVPFLRWGAVAGTIESALRARGPLSGVPWRLLNVARWVSVFSVDARG